MSRRLLLIVSLVTILLVSGCARNQVIHNITDAPVIPSSALSLTIEQVRNTIISAAHAKNWQVQQIDDGHMLATVKVRKHTAVVDIYYSTDTYSIIYNNSEALRKKGDTIHRNYNKWIIKLNKVIRLKLNAL